jgi:hypothetical protein
VAEIRVSSIGGIILTTQEEFVSMPLYPPKIPHAWNGSWASASAAEHLGSKSRITVIVLNVSCVEY